jgi:photoactive yellow protein
MESLPMEAEQHKLVFDTADAGSLLDRLDHAELEALPFGVIQMDRSGTVLQYNATESRYSGLSRERVLGRHFFREVAPCSNNHRVAGRYALPELDETVEYTFALRMKPVPVTLRMLKPPLGAQMYLLVQWT